MTINKKEKRKKDKEQKKQTETAPSISFFTLYRYTSKQDLFLIAAALCSSVIAGLTLPYSIAIVANVFHSMVQYDAGVQKGNKDATTFLATIHDFTIKYFCLGLITFICGYLGQALMEIAATNQIFKIRAAYLQAALNQDFSYYDTRVTGDFASKMTEDIIKVEEGIGGKLSKLFYSVSFSLGCITLALVKGWKLALLCLMSTPVSMLLVGISGFFANRLSKKEAAESSKASAVAEEVFSSIRTVYAFSGQQKEIERYREPLRAARKLAIKKEIFTGLTMGLLFLSMFCSYGLSFYIGVYLITVDPVHYNAGVMFAVFFGVVQGLFGFGIVGSLVNTFGSARGAAAQIFSVIDNKPTINPLLNKGITLKAVEGIIEFKNVRFTYPSRPDIPVLQGIDLMMRRGQSVALVGASGGGKSTIVQLILRYYDVNSGQVLIDGHDVRELSVRWLRAQIGLVGQEPVLFNTTVRENIRYGREDASDADIEAAARQANIHHFIIKLPQGYNTLVGERGAAISGGQKQRIAIARALIRNPIILLLDEATSALDTSSEFKVQKALDEASKGRTTVIVAHRLSTIRNVDFIYVLKGGKVVEKGNHEELMKLHGLYYNMLALQQPQLTSTHTPLTSISERGTIDLDSTEDLQLKHGLDGLPISVESENKLKPPALSFWQVIKLNQPEWAWITFGSICSTIIGFAMPLYILAFGSLFGALSSDDPKYLMKKVSEVCVIFVIIGLVLGIFSFIESIAFGVAGARLTERIRLRMFENLMTQQIAFYDDQTHSTGTLCSRLSSEAAYIRRATGQRIGVYLQGVGSVLLSFSLSMIFEYRIGLCACIIFPIIGLIVYFQGKFTHKEHFGSTKTVEKSNKIAVEAVANVRTVASLGREWRFLDEYIKELRPALGPAKKSAHIRGLVAGVSQSIFIFTNCATLTYGSHLIVYDGIRYEHVLIATQSLQISAIQVEAAFTISPDLYKGMSAASQAVEIINCKPTMYDPEKATPFEGTGEASFSQVEFRYPTRPAEKVLKGLDLQIHRGKSIALVGESGCGKSTVISLLQRFYDPEKGIVALDGIPLPQLRFIDIRGNLGLVSQEPVLFDRTIGQNIAYGDNSRSPSVDEIITAAKEANVHTFIESLPQKYDTRIGSKGVQLSGGQKQRVAIARALVRRPNILLLDEATSALDTESEKVVQEALDHAKAGRTCVTIAHRLSTIVDSDTIYVFNRGRIVESGTHEHLLSLEGVYHDLYSK